MDHNTTQLLVFHSLAEYSERKHTVNGIYSPTSFAQKTLRHSQVRKLLHILRQLSHYLCSQQSSPFALSFVRHTRLTDLSFRPELRTEMASTGPEGFIQSLRESIHMAVHTHSYKNGAFKEEISKATPLLKAIHILVASPLLSLDEKTKIAALRSIAVDYEKGVLNRLSETELALKGLAWFPIQEVFEADAKRRGEYVPPMMAQNKDIGTGRITSTDTIDSDGNVQHFQGGKAGVVPGAPSGFNAANVNLFEEVKSDSQSKGGHHPNNNHADSNGRADKNRKKAKGQFPTHLKKSKEMLYTEQLG